MIDLETIKELDFANTLVIGDKVDVLVGDTRGYASWPALILNIEQSEYINPRTHLIEKFNKYFTVNYYELKVHKTEKVLFDSILRKI